MLHRITPSKPIDTTQDTEKRLVGGQMILAQPSWGGAIIESSSDRTGLSVLTATSI